MSTYDTMRERAEAAEARVAQLEAIKTPVCEWTPGIPPNVYTDECFIARTKFGDPMVLRALPRGWSYDFTTADSTYIKAEDITHWMQFPNSDYISPAQAQVRQLRAALAQWQVKDSEGNYPDESAFYTPTLHPIAKAALAETEATP